MFGNSQDNVVHYVHIHTYIISCVKCDYLASSKKNRCWTKWDESDCV